MSNKILLFIGLIISISLVSSQGTGGGGATPPILIPCEEWCEDLKPYRTFCNENNECELDKESRDKYMSSFNGDCRNAENRNECNYWWTNYYQQERISNLEKVNRNLSWIIVILLLIIIINIIELIITVKGGKKK